MDDSVGAYANEGYWSCWWVELQRQDSFTPHSGWNNASQESVSDCKANTMFPGLIWWFSLPEEWVLFFYRSRVWQSHLLQGNIVHLQSTQFHVNDIFSQKQQGRLLQIIGGKHSQGIQNPCFQHVTKYTFLHSPLDFFPLNCRALNDKASKDNTTMTKCYQGKWSPSMLADNCWTVKGDAPFI